MAEGANISSVLLEAAVKGLIAIAFIMLVGRFALRPVFSPCRDRGRA